MNEIFLGPRFRPGIVAATLIAVIFTGIFLAL